MNNKADAVSRLRLARYIANMQLENIDDFTDVQQTVLKQNLRKIKNFLFSEQVSEDTANELMRELHPAFQYFSNTFSVFYKISRRSVDDYSGEGFYFPYKKHSVNIDHTFFIKDSHENKESIPSNRQIAEDMQWTGVGTHGLCFVCNEGDILKYLRYGTQLTISVLDPLVFPLYRTLVRANTLFGMQYQISQAYISENILLDDYRILKQMLYRSDDLDSFFLRSDFENTVLHFSNDIRKYPDTEDVITFMKSIKGIYLKANCNREDFVRILESEFPGSSHEYLFHDEEIINRERRWIGISETVEETRNRILAEAVAI